MKVSTTTCIGGQVLVFDISFPLPALFKKKLLRVESEKEILLYVIDRPPPLLKALFFLTIFPEIIAFVFAKAIPPPEALT